jgi:tetratricopeptide (TPR) repeat protein
MDDIARLKTDTFRDRAHYSEAIKQQLADARRAGTGEAVAAVEQQFGPLDTVEAGALVDLLLSYRAVSAHDRMVALYERLPPAVRGSVLVREQAAFALNRVRRRDEALQLLQQVVEEQGPSSETCGLIGRIYKDRWAEATADRRLPNADEYLTRAIAAYTAGFDTDPRDAYPGINAITLLDIKGDAASRKRRDELIPMVQRAVRQRLQSKAPDYWDYATVLELAVLQSDENAAREALGQAIDAVRESWEPAATANNLSLIARGRAERDAAEPWLADIIATLERRGPVTP